MRGACRDDRSPRPRGRSSARCGPRFAGGARRDAVEGNGPLRRRDAGGRCLVFGIRDYGPHRGPWSPASDARLRCPGLRKSAPDRRCPISPRRTHRPRGEERGCMRGSKESCRGSTTKHPGGLHPRGVCGCGGGGISGVHTEQLSRITQDRLDHVPVRTLNGGEYISVKPYLFPYARDFCNRGVVVQ